MVETRSQGPSSNTTGTVPAATEMESSTSTPMSPSNNNGQGARAAFATEEEEFAHLQSELTAKRRREAMAAIRMELAGETPENPHDLEGLPANRRKRAASSTPSDAPVQRLLRLSNPPTFEGKSLHEMSEYESGWKIQLEAANFSTESKAILYAATYLRGTARSTWSARETEYTTWQSYMDWCRSIVVDPANRMANAQLRLKNLHQRQGQSIRDLVHQIEELERDIPVQTETERKAWLLLNSLTTETRREVMRENKLITSREQVISSAQRQEELSRTNYYYDKKGESERANTSKTGGQKTYPHRGRPRTGSSQPIQAPASDSQATSMSDKTCYNCNKVGHISRYCRDKKRTATGSNSAPVGSSKN